jgi:hypothetical protein
MFHTGLSRWYSKQIQFRFRTLHSLFSDVSVSLNEKLVSPPTSMYPYRAYINPIPISYIRKSFGVLEPFFNRRCLSMCSVASSDDVWAFSVVQIGRSFIKERSQNFGSRSFGNRSEPSIGRHGRTERHTSTNPIPISYIRKSFGVLEPFFNRRCLSMCSVASSDDVWAFSVLQLVL